MKSEYNEIIDECVYAVMCCHDHYCDEQFNEGGRHDIRQALSNVLGNLSFGHEYSNYRDCGGTYSKFSDRIIWPEGWDKTDNYE